MEPPVFMEKMTYRCLSPIFIRKKRTTRGEDYLHPNDPDYEKLLLSNLVSKAQALALSGNSNELAEHLTNLQLTPKGKIYKKGITIKQNTPQASKLIGYSFEFELVCSYRIAGDWLLYRLWQFGKPGVWVCGDGKMDNRKTLRVSVILKYNHYRYKHTDEKK